MSVAETGPLGQQPLAAGSDAGADVIELLVLEREPTPVARVGDRADSLRVGQQFDGSVRGARYPYGQALCLAPRPSNIRGAGRREMESWYG